MQTIQRAIGTVLIVFCGALAGVAHAAATFDSVTGQVTMTGPGGSTVTATKGAAIPNGTLVQTGAMGSAAIKFDDGGAVILQHDTHFRVVNYTFNSARPKDGRSVFDFLKGAARFITGLVAHSEYANYSLRTPVATMGVRGTRFDVVRSGGRTYVKVDEGPVTVTNAAGTTTIQGGEIYEVANAGTLPHKVAGPLPSGVKNTMDLLDKTPLPAGTTEAGVGPGSTSAGAGEATGAAGGGFTTTDAAIAAGVFGATAISGIHNSGTTTHH